MIVCPFLWRLVIFGLFWSISVLLVFSVPFYDPFTISPFRTFYFVCIFLKHCSLWYGYFLRSIQVVFGRFLSFLVVSVIYGKRSSFFCTFSMVRVTGLSCHNREGYIHTQASILSSLYTRGDLCKHLSLD